MAWQPAGESLCKDATVRVWVIVISKAKSESRPSWHTAPSAPAQQGWGNAAVSRRPARHSPLSACSSSSWGRHPRSRRSPAPGSAGEASAVATGAWHGLCQPGMGCRWEGGARNPATLMWRPQVPGMGRASLARDAAAAAKGRHRHPALLSQPRPWLSRRSAGCPRHALSGSGGSAAPLAAGAAPPPPRPRPRPRSPRSPRCRCRCPQSPPAPPRPPPPPSSPQ